MYNKIKRYNNNELRNFGLIFGIFIPIIFGFLLPIIFKNNIPYWPWIFSIIMICIALCFSTILSPLYTIWMKLSLILGVVNTRIILFINFYLIFTPYGIIMRIFGKDPLLKNLNEKEITYRISKIDSNFEYSITNLEKPF
tara:strand:- start:2048 stop:2467 length:420 start_codon:yes stop_codon:yes gene_type:complete